MKEIPRLTKDDYRENQSLEKKLGDKVILNNKRKPSFPNENRENWQRQCPFQIIEMVNLQVEVKRPSKTNGQSF